MNQKCFPLTEYIREGGKNNCKIKQEAEKELAEDGNRRDREEINIMIFA